MSHLENYKLWLNNVSDLEKKELLAIKEDEKEIEERFCMPLAFGTAGMRGIIGLGTYRMNDYTVSRATQGLANYMIEQGQEIMDRGVVIAYDTRLKSTDFAIKVAKVLAYNKIKSFIFEDVRPVPMCSFAVRELNAYAGIMITASHNPKEYNGYKVYGQDGAQMSPEDTSEVVKRIENITDYFSVKEADISTYAINDLNNEKINEYITVIGKDIDDKYFNEIEKLLLSPEAVEKERNELKIVYTPIHGAGYKPVTNILSRMKFPINVVEAQALPDTEFSTVNQPNPENEDALRMGIELAKKLNSDVVIGTDPDCDRMGVALKQGDEFKLLNGNQIGMLLMDYILKRHTELNSMPKNPAVVKTIVTTSLAKKVAESYGVTCFDVLTGFKFIGEKIKQWEIDNSYTFMFGYEESYGYLSGTHARDKDAVVASMLFCEMCAYYKANNTSVAERLEEIYKQHGYYIDKSVATKYAGLDGMSKMKNIMDNIRNTKFENIAGYQVEFFADYNSQKKYFEDGKVEDITLPKSNVLYYGLTGGDWLCVRPSGTEPKLKVYVSASGKTFESAKEKSDKLFHEMNEFL